MKNYLINEKSANEFNPIIPQPYNSRFIEFLAILKNSYSYMHKELIIEEINIVLVNEETIELAIYLSVLYILRDLVNQGCKFIIESDKLHILIEDDSTVKSKGATRHRMSFEKNAQISEPSIMSFISRMESKRQFNDGLISIHDLIGNRNELIRKIKNKGNIISPYIQLVSNEIDEFSPYKLSDIWKYFRLTWSIPYKTMPGRNMYYLVRDASQCKHPIIGIFALGNTILNLGSRDNYIGWTVDSISNSMKRKNVESLYENQISNVENAKVIKKSKNFIETITEYRSRIETFSTKVITQSLTNINNYIDEIFKQDLYLLIDFKQNTESIVKELRDLSSQLRKNMMNNKLDYSENTDFSMETRKTLYLKKRASELANLLESRQVIQSAENDSYSEWLNKLIKNDSGRKAIHTAIIANRKNKIGSNIMEIIVCGAVQPYNELLGGKLVSMLACSPQVVEDYNRKYKKYVSEIASRMKGESVIRDNRLVALGTTSLYSQGSSQYNRIKVYNDKEMLFEFKKLGLTEGYGSLFFSKDTTNLLQKILVNYDGGKKINHVFGEGTSPRFRLISSGLKFLGLKPAILLKHNSPRVIYYVELAKNAKEFLNGETNDIEYYFMDKNMNVIFNNNDIISYWKNRWLSSRIESVDLVERLNRIEDFKSIKDYLL